MFKLQISSIFNFDRAHKSWISGVLDVNCPTWNLNIVRYVHQIISDAFWPIFFPSWQKNKCLTLFLFFFLGGKKDPVEKFKGTMGTGMTIYLPYIFKILIKAVKTVTFYPSHTWPCSLAWSPPKFKLVPPQLQNHSHKHNSRRYINRNG